MAANQPEKPVNALTATPTTPIGSSCFSAVGAGVMFIVVVVLMVLLVIMPGDGAGRPALLNKRNENARSLVMGNRNRVKIRIFQI